MSATLRFGSRLSRGDARLPHPLSACGVSSTLARSPPYELRLECPVFAVVMLILEPIAVPAQCLLSEMHQSEVTVNFAGPA